MPVPETRVEQSSYEREVLFERIDTTFDLPER